MWTSLTTYVPKVKERVCPQRAASACRCGWRRKSAETLVKSKAERDKLKKFLADNNMYLYTVNAFPYGPSRTDRQGAGLRAGLADGGAHPIHDQRRRILADVAPADVFAVDPDRAARLQAARHRPGRGRQLHRARAAGRRAPRSSSRQRTGRTVTLALEPEPYCFLETTDETVDYFTNHLYSGASARELAKLAGLPISEAIARCASTSASCSTSAIRRSSTRTSPRRCRSWSMPAFRSSSCRRPPRCTCPK